MLPKRDRPPGMFDVARSAGVSHQTVSRVLNDHPNVRAETRTRVLAVIQELGYRRNTAARALVTSRSGTIGVITNRTALYGPTSILLSVEAAAREHGWFVSLVSVVDTSEDALRSGLEHFMNQSVEGIVAIGATADFFAFAATAAPGVPMVNVTALARPPAGIFVATVDNARGARLAVNHLIGEGHRDIAHIRGPLDSLEASARERGWRGAVGRAGLTAGRLIVGDWTARAGHEAGQELLRGPLPEAVFVGNDEMALGMLRAFSEAGVRVPEQTSVVGFDDIAAAAYANPPLTTVRQDFETLGRRCLDLLARAIAGETSVKPALVQPTLLLRQSTAPRRTPQAAPQVNLVAST